MPDHRAMAANRLLDAAEHLERQFSHTNSAAFWNKNDTVPDAMLDNMTYFRLSGYAAYGETQLQAAAMQQAMRNLIEACHIRNSPLCFLYVGHEKSLHILVGVHAQGGRSSVRSAMTALDECVVEAGGLHPGFLARAQSWTGLSCGDLACPALPEDFFRSLANEEGMVAILAKPVGEAERSEEAAALENLISAYSGLNSMPNCNDFIRSRIRPLRLLLEKYRLRLQNGERQGLWQTCIWAGAPDRETLHTLQGQLAAHFFSHTSDNSVFTAQHYELRDTPFWTENRWLFPTPREESAAQAVLSFPLPLLENFCACPLTAQQLMEALHLPQSSVAGFRVKGKNDTLAPTPTWTTETQSVVLGQCENRTYSLPLDFLRRHVFLTGQTQFGKTNTVLSLLEQLRKKAIPFIVLEGAKKEYHFLKYRPGFEAMRVYTLGEDGLTLPFNLFEPEQGTALSQHIQAITALLTRAVESEPGSPLPAVLRQLIPQCYQKYGWNVQHDRAGDDPDRLFPTIDTMIELLPSAMREIPYGKEVHGNVSGFVLLRLKYIASLFGNANSITGPPIAELMQTSAVIELDDLADDAVKALVCGALMVRVCEYARQQPVRGALNSFLVVEEAHTVLQPGENNVGAKLLADMLAEVSAYGLGILVSDQSAACVHPNAVRNTAVKITHCLSSGADIEVLRSAVGAQQQFPRWVSGLQIGECLVSVAGVPGVSKVKVPLLPRSTKGNPACLVCERNCVNQQPCTLDVAAELRRGSSANALLTRVLQKNETDAETAVCCYGAVLQELQSTGTAEITPSVARAMVWRVYRKLHFETSLSLQLRKTLCDTAYAQEITGEPREDAAFLRAIAQAALPQREKRSFRDSTRLFLFERSLGGNPSALTDYVVALYELDDLALFYSRLPVQDRPTKLTPEEKQEAALWVQRREEEICARLQVHKSEESRWMTLVLCIYLQDHSTSAYVRFIAEYMSSLLQRRE